MFTKIDMNKYERAEQYNHFLHVWPCNYSVTANLDVTEFLRAVKYGGYKLYPALIFALGKAVNGSVALRHARDGEGNLGFYDCCHPSYTIPNATEHGFSGIWTEYNADFSKFYKEYLKDVELYKTATAYAPKANQPQNTYYVSCTPKLNFTSLSLNLYHGAECLTPMFTIGKYFEAEQRTLVPLSACLHHAVCDGFHASKLYEDMQFILNDYKAWIF